MDIASIKKILRVSVSLEDFATLQTNLHLLRQAGWVPDDYVNCPSMTLSDLETVFDLLEHPVQILHYLVRRTELHETQRFVGDEMDHLGCYLQTLFAEPEFGDADQTTVYLTGMSDVIDNYYVSKDAGFEVEKPRPATSNMFQRILTKLEERDTYRWTEIGVILNRIAPDDQRMLEREIRNLEKVVHRRWHEESHRNMLIQSSPRNTEYVVAAVLYKNGNRQRRREYTETAGMHGLEEAGAKYCLVIAVNIDDRSMPYHSIVLVERRDEEEEVSGTAEEDD